MLQHSQKKVSTIGPTTGGLSCTIAWSPCGTILAVAVGNENVLVHDRHGALVDEIALQKAVKGSAAPVTELQVGAVHAALLASHGPPSVANWHENLPPLNEAMSKQMLHCAMQWDPEGKSLVILCRGQSQILLYTLAARTTVRLDSGLTPRVSSVHHL